MHFKEIKNILKYTVPYHSDIWFLFQTLVLNFWITWQMLVSFVFLKERYKLKLLAP